METVNSKSYGPSRTASEICERIRLDIREERIPFGRLLPGLRSLSEQFQVSRNTLQRAMAILISEGQIAAEPRRGYRVLGGLAEQEKVRPLAYVTDGAPRQWNSVEQQLLTGFQRTAQAHGWSLLGIGAEEREQDEVMRQVIAARVWGLLFDSLDPLLLAKVRAAGIPAVVVDCWVEDEGIDVVLQDDYQGGFFAATHLAAMGHRRIAWLGPTIESAHSMARLAGAIMGLRRRGIELMPTRPVADPMDMNAWTNNARAWSGELLSSAQRPTAVLALWQIVTAGLVAAGRDLGLVPGHDFAMVGWCTEEAHDDFCRAIFLEGQPSAMMTWSVQTMAKLAVSRLAERRANPNLDAVRINVPVKLRLAGQPLSPVAPPEQSSQDDVVVRVTNGAG